MRLPLIGPGKHKEELPNLASVRITTCVHKRYSSASPSASPDVHAIVKATTCGHKARIKPCFLHDVIAPSNCARVHSGFWSWRGSAVMSCQHYNLFAISWIFSVLLVFLLGSSWASPGPLQAYHWLSWPPLGLSGSFLGFLPCCNLLSTLHFSPRKHTPMPMSSHVDKTTSKVQFYMMTLIPSMLMHTVASQIVMTCLQCVENTTLFLSENTHQCQCHPMWTRKSQKFNFI